MEITPEIYNGVQRTVGQFCSKHQIPVDLDIESIIQEILIIVWQQYDHTRGNVRAFVWILTRNRIADLINRRKYKNQKLSDYAKYKECKEKKSSTKVVDMQMVKSLSPLLDLLYRGASYRDLATLYDVTISAMKSRIKQERKIMQKGVVMLELTSAIEEGWFHGQTT